MCYRKTYHRDLRVLHTAFVATFSQHSDGAIGLDPHVRIIECMSEEPNMQPSKVTLQLTNWIDALMVQKSQLGVYVFRNL